MLLAGDIGGTKTDLAIYSPEAGPRRPLAEAEYRSGHYPSLEALVREFLASTALPVTWACFDVAGPVIDGRAKITNLPWDLSESGLAGALDLRIVHLVNDLEAVARGVPALIAEDLVTLNVGEPVAHGAIAVVAPGTGLGEAFLIWDGTRYQAFPSEGGHAEFAPATEHEVGLLVELLKQRDHVSVERVCSGPGLVAIYEYLRSAGVAPEGADVAPQLAAAPDHAPIIAKAGLRETPDPLSAATLAMFAEILGAEAGNLALKVLSTGGVYIAGGIPSHMLPILQRGDFLRAFVRKGRMAGLMGRMPVHVVMRQAAIFGAAIRGLELGADRERAAPAAKIRGNPSVTR
jgi:glucokinase